jgi:hypothetical protein
VRRGVDMKKKTQELLQRVDISRTFDIEGVLEVLSEISDRCNEQHDSDTEEGVSVRLSRGDEKISTASQLETAKGERNQVVIGKVEESRDVEILDSEAEDDSDYELDPPQINIELRGTPSRNNGNSIPDTGVHGSIGVPSGCNTELVIIDNIATPVHELFSRMEKNEGISPNAPLVP